MISPQGIKIPRHDVRLFCFLHKRVKLLKLMMPYAEFESQMHEKHDNVFKLQLNDQPFNPFFKVMKLFVGYAIAR